MGWGRRDLHMNQCISDSVPLVCLLFCRQSWQFLNLMPADFVVKSTSWQTMSEVLVVEASGSKASPSLSSRQYAAQSEPGVTSMAQTWTSRSSARESNERNRVMVGRDC